jgi:hypothetical protein
MYIYTTGRLQEYKPEVSRHVRGCCVTQLTRLEPKDVKLLQQAASKTGAAAVAQAGTLVTEQAASIERKSD